MSSSKAQERRAESLGTRLREACDELVLLMEKLEVILPEPVRRGYSAGGGGGGRKKADGSAPAWNTQAAGVILAIHAGSRELEEDIRYGIAHVFRTRGGSDRNTEKALEEICALCGGAEEVVVRNAIRLVERWGWQAKVALGEKEPWRHIPVIPGMKPARCPWCKFMTLRYQPLSGVVRCVSPPSACKDDMGRKPFGKLEFNLVSGEPILVWQDQSTGLGVK
jgi:hypothetical protein